MRPWKMATVVALAGSAACAGAGRVQAPSLVGAWEQESEPSAEAAGRRQTFVFNPGGSALWIFTTPASRDTFAVQYRFDPAPTPARLDLSGFASGPLQGRTLYCIVDRVSPERFRMDCEPGRPGVDPEAARPGAFNPQQTVTYRRLPR